MKQSPRRLTAAVLFAAGTEVDENRDGRKPENRDSLAFSACSQITELALPGAAPDGAWGVFFGFAPKLNPARLAGRIERS